MPTGPALHLLMLIACVMAGAAPLQAEALRFDQPEQEFHPALADHDVIAHYAFTNAGTAPVTITATRTSCGCTTTTLDKTTYQPGEKGEILATFAIGDRSGLQDKTIQVDTDAGAAIMLHLVVHLPEPPTVAPNFVSWARFEDKRPRLVTITVPAGSPCQITGASSSNPVVTATVSAGDKPGTWTLTLVPTDTSRPANTMVEVLTNTGRKLYVFANVVDTLPR
jgi:hypothetical protein